jgi:predicted transcriptional regulator
VAEDGCTYFKNYCLTFTFFYSWFYLFVQEIFSEEVDLGNYRGRLDIIADILQVVSQNPKKTHIMYQANLSYKVLKKYLRKMNEASLISFVGEKQCYALTVKGRNFLDTYNEYSRHSKKLEKRLSEINRKKKVLEEDFLNM